MVEDSFLLSLQPSAENHWYLALMHSPNESQFVVDDDGRLYHLGVKTSDVAPNIILVGDPARALRVAERFETVLSEVRRREFVTLTGEVRGMTTTVIGTGIGTDNVEIAVLEAYAALSLDLSSMQRLSDPPPISMIRVGTSGGAQSDIAAGTLCVAEYALGLDSTGLYYDLGIADAIAMEIEQQAEALLDSEVSSRARFKGKLKPYASRADPKLYQTLLGCAERMDDEVEGGVTVTAPGFYGASSRRVEGLVNTVPDIKRALSRLDVLGRRAINFEMESSLLFLLSEALGIRACTICPAISQPGNHDAIPPYAPRVEASIDIALQALAAVSGPAAE